MACGRKYAELPQGGRQRRCQKTCSDLRFVIATPCMGDHGGWRGILYFRIRHDPYCHLVLTLHQARQRFHFGIIEAVLGAVSIVPKGARTRFVPRGICMR